MNVIATYLGTRESTTTFDVCEKITFRANHSVQHDLLELAYLKGLPSQVPELLRSVFARTAYLARAISKERRTQRTRSTSATWTWWLRARFKAPYHFGGGVRKQD